jgi:hypothetical protein
MRKYVFLFLLCGCLFFACDRNDAVPTPVPLPAPPPVITCECSNTLVAGDRYIYPMGYKGLSTDFRVYQVPDSLLTTMSTLGVIQSLEHNPALMFFGVHNSVLMGRDAVLKKLNVSAELNKRPDMGRQLLNYYKRRYPCCIDSISVSFDRYVFMTRWAFFDIICAQDSIVNKLTLPEKKEFAKIILEKDNEWSKYPEYFYIDFPTGRSAGLFLLNWLMQSAAYTPYTAVLANDTALQWLSASASFNSNGMNNAALEKLLQHAKQFAGP